VAKPSVQPTQPSSATP